MTQTWKVWGRLNGPLLKWVECSPIAQETEVQYPVESYQRLKQGYLIPHSLTLSVLRYVSRVKWNDPGKGVAPSSTSRCCSYLKGSPRVTSNYSRQLYFTFREREREKEKEKERETETERKWDEQTYQKTSMNTHR